MENREEGLQILYNRIKDTRTELGVTTFRRTPSSPIEESDLLCVFMSEGTDRVIKPASRNPLGYPARREVEIVFELINVDTFDIRSFYTQFRRIILSSAQLTKDCFVKEVRTVGPMGYRTLTNVVGIQLVLAMSYTDEG